MQIRSRKVTQIAHMPMTFDPMCVTVLKGGGLLHKSLFSVHKKQTKQTTVNFFLFQTLASMQLIGFLFSLNL